MAGRPLIIAESCNPEWVSVPLEGWSHSRELMRLTGAHLVTQVRNRDALLRAGLVEGTDFTAIDSERVAKPLWKLSDLLRGGSGKGWTTITAFSALSYYYFERLVWKEFGGRIRSGEFDIVHRVTPLSPTTPSIIAKRVRRAGAGFVLGPLNGGVPWPKEFDAARRAEKEWLSYVRGAYRMLPGHRATYDHASAIIAGSRDTRKQLPQQHRAKTTYIPENAIDPERFTARRTRMAERPLRCVFVGRLVPYKGADMLLRGAAPLVRAEDVRIDIIGDGPERPLLERIIQEEGLGEGVRLVGWVDHKDLSAKLAESDLFTFPSIREFGGAVVLEAMSVGVAPVVVDYGGPGELVTDLTGRLLPICSREHIERSLRSTLEELASDPGVVDEMGRRALIRARSLFTWEAKARQTAEVYRWVRGERADIPDFGMPLPDPVDNEAVSTEARRGAAAAP